MTTADRWGPGAASCSAAEVLKAWRVKGAPTALRHTAMLTAIIVVAVLLRFWLVRIDDGVVYPDEIYQSLEPAHRLAFGSGLIAWEFERGVRHWAMPALLAVVMRAFDVVGVAPATAARLLMALLSGLTAWACARLVRAVGGSKAAELVAASVWAGLNVSLLLGTRALSETATLLPLTCAFVWLVQKPERAAAGGALLGFAVMLRLQVTFVVPAAVAILALRSGRAAVLRMALGLVVALAVMGAIDWLTWGKPFHSAIEYVRFNLLEHGADSFGRAPLGYYTGRLMATLGLGWVALCVGSVLGAKRAWPFLAVLACFFGVHLAIGHKELRFLLPVMPFVVAAFALGVDVIRERMSGVQAVIPGFTAAFVLAFQTPLARLTFGELGVADRPTNEIAIGANANINSLVRRAGHEPWVCGLWVQAAQLGYFGAFSTLHRSMPLFGAERGPAELSSVNAVVSRGAPTPEAAEVVRAGDVALWRLPNTSCAPAPDFDSRL